MRRKLDTILFIEDDPDIQVVAQLALEALGGFSVTVCSSGQEALQVAHASNFDLIMLDVMMPGMDGPTTLVALRRLPQLATTPAIFLTARVQRHDVAAYLQLGAAAVIPKPFDPMKLSEMVDQIWRAAHSVDGCQILRD